MAATSTDGEAVARALEGDAQAFGTLFRKYGRMVHALALARTTRPAAAAELARKVFERAWADLDRVPAGTTFRQFLVSVLNEQATAYIRDHGRSMQMLRVGSREAKRAAGPMELRKVLSDLPRDEAALVILEVLGRLPPHYEAPFLLRYMEGMGVPEIAEVTGLPDAEVRTVLDGARRLFERELKRGLEAAE